MAVKEYIEEKRSVKDFEDARKAVLVGPGPSAVEVLAGSLGSDESQRSFRRMLAQLGPTTWVCICEGPHTSDWGWRERQLQQLGWQVRLVKFVTTEFGECAARSRCAMIAWRHDCGVEDVEKYVIRGATTRPMSAVVGKVEADHQGLAWVRPWKVSIEPGIPRQPLLPQVVGHVWKEPGGERENLHGMDRFVGRCERRLEHEKCCGSTTEEGLLAV